MNISITRLSLIAFISGACVMVLEMVGARMLAPFLGTSIVVWTSLIGIILASLSVGYWLGGRLADRTVSQRVLAWLLLGAALTILLTALSHTLILQWVTQLESLHTSAILAASLLFALPAVFCGMISPYVTRLALSDVDTAGATVGTLNAISTVGSIIGTFLGGFVLIAWVSSPTIIYGIALVMAASALLAGGKAQVPVLVTLGLIAGIGGVFGAKISSLVTADGLIYFQETPYNSIQIKEGVQNSSRRTVRVMITDENRTQSMMFVDAPAEPALEYAKYFAIGTTLKPAAQRVLMLGGGGYSVPKWLLGPDAPLPAGSFQLDVVELDPGVSEAAERFLGLDRSNQPNLTIFHEDARRFVNRSAKATGPGYELILGDVFNSRASVPFHVGTREAAQSIASSLSDEGIFMMNVISAVEGDDGRLYRAIHAAFADVFGTTATFLSGAPENPSQVQNVILLAAKQPVDLERLLADAPQLAPLLANRYSLALADDVPALSDRFAPVERYLGSTY